ncbi:hypothetical protein PMAYCL1PPCAC_24024, partial [Pristionchus mayeri]
VKVAKLTKSELEQYILSIVVCHRDRIQRSMVIGEVEVALNGYPWHHSVSSFPLDRESIGTLRVRLQSISFDSSDLRLGSIVVCGKLFKGGRRTAREQSGRIKVSNPNPEEWLRMFVFTLWELNGFVSSRSLGQAIVNHSAHRRSVPYPAHCTCSECGPWQRLIDNPSLAISFPIPLSITTLDDPSLGLL